MLCTQPQQRPSFMHNSYDVGMPASSPKSYGGAVAVAPAAAGAPPSSSSPSASSLDSSPVSSSSTAARHRHHARSYSSDAQRFLDQSKPQQDTSTTIGMLPVRSRKPSPPRTVDATDTAAANGASSSLAPSTEKRILPTRKTSPPRKDMSLEAATAEEIEAEEKLALLREAQKNRRPRMMRLTPAFSSLPGRSPPMFLSQETLSAPLDHVRMQTQQQVQRAEQVSTPEEINKVAFPTTDDTPPSDKSTTPLESDPPTPVQSTVASSSRKSIALRINGANKEEPGVGLQIDLACIPTPSMQDANGPASTSYIPDMVRDRNGNPIKPSLKSSRNSVGNLFNRPGRSDSTPELPISIRAKSVPTTPTLPKAVHFDAKLEHVKLFKNRQRPTAVSRDGSPEQTETETEEEKDFPYIWRRSQHSPVSPSSTSPSLATPQPYAPNGSAYRSRSPSAAEETEQLVLRLPNFPSSTRLSVDREVFLERIFLADDLRSVKGTVRVRNISFEKWVAVRYTLDHWTTTGEVSAEHAESIQGGNADRFTFSIKLNELLNWPRGSPAHETKSMFLCIRYTVSGAEHWDNNEGHNYQLDFRKRQMPPTPLSTPITTGAALQPPKATVAASIGQGTAKSRVLEMAKKGVHGGTAKGGFAIEDLRRELDRLRSDEDEEEEPTTATQLRTFASEMAKRKQSPPSSPGRSGSPTPWTARYDFGASLKNPRSGSRTTGQGRAAALDYFSAKPTTATPAASSQMVRGGASYQYGASPSTSSGAPPTKPSISIEGTSPSRHADIAKPSPDFSHRFGMISPGLGDGPVEHRPVSTSAGNSVEQSPETTPSSSSLGVPRGTHGGRGASERFYSFPPNRHMQSPGAATPPAVGNGMAGSQVAPVVGAAFFEDAVLAQARGSPLGSPIQSRKVPPSPRSVSSRLAEVKASEERKAENGLIVEDYSPSASPVSPCGSPNPFSPSVSVSSNESDTTISTLVPDEQPHHRLKPRKAADGLSVSNDSAESSDGSSTPDARQSREASIDNGEDDESHGPRYRPASMSDYQELINRFCWNSDLVPSGGSTVLVTPPSRSPTNTFSPPLSGATTPTLC
ncbi:hypothetical protein L7F22_005890 [Adiantum nelumboides]|nr:hypothetical protein [Adiantum nelumboides]